MKIPRVALSALVALCVVAGCGDASSSSPSSHTAAAPKAESSAEAVWTSDYDGALRIAAQDKKMVLAAFTGSDWCPPCQRLASEVFQTDVFKRWAAKHFVLVEFDFPRRTPIEPAVKARNETFAKTLGITGFPTVVMMNADGRELGRLGYVPGGADAWITAAEKKIPK